MSGNDEAINRVFDTIERMTNGLADIIDNEKDLEGAEQPPVLIAMMLGCADFFWNEFTELQCSSPEVGHLVRRFLELHRALIFHTLSENEGSKQIVIAEIEVLTAYENPTKSKEIG